MLGMYALPSMHTSELWSSMRKSGRHALLMHFSSYTLGFGPNVQPDFA